MITKFCSPKIELFGRSAENISSGIGTANALILRDSGNQLVLRTPENDLLLRSSGNATSEVHPAGDSNDDGDDEGEDEGEFDTGRFYYLMLSFALAHDVPFSALESPEFRDLIEYARLCPDASLPKFSLASMSSELYNFYGSEMDRLKTRLSEMKGRFAVTIDEWKSGDNDILAVTVHFHNEQFRLESHTIGFEDIRAEMAYTDQSIYKRFESLLKEFHINGRIISITKSNDGPFNTMLNRFSAKVGGKITGFVPRGKTQCIEHVFNLAAGAFLDHTDFKPRKSFDLQRIVSSAIQAVREHPVLKSSFADEDTDSEEESTDIRIRNSQWFSTFKILDKLLCFEEELAKIPTEVKSRAGCDLNGMTFESIGYVDWSYITRVHNVLGAFVQPVMDLQGFQCGTASLLIPYVKEMSKVLEDMEYSFIRWEGPSLYLGLKSAREKLLEYYPVQETCIRSLKHLYVASVLDPRIKLRGLRDLGFSASVIKAVESYFYDVHDRYKRKHKKAMKAKKPWHQRKDRRLFRVAKSPGKFFSSGESSSNDSEIEDYLYERTVPKSCDIGEYYRGRKDTFPVIYEMAKDYLSIMATSAPAESQSGQTKDLITDSQDSLSPYTMKMIATLKSRGYSMNRKPAITNDQGNIDERDSLSSESTTESKRQVVGPFDDLVIDFDRVFPDDEGDSDDEEEEEDEDASDGNGKDGKGTDDTIVPS